MDKLITKFLAAGLLPDVGSQEQLKYVDAAVADLVKKLSKNPALIITYTLAGLNTDLKIDNPAGKDADDAIRKHWKTIDNNLKAEPRQIWRSLLWEALSLQSKSAEVAAVIWYTASSVLPHINLGYAERSVLDQFLISLRDKIEASFASRTIPADKASGDQPSWADFEVKSVFTEAFKLDLLKACGPHDAANAPLEGGNPNWPAGNAAWASVFSDKVARAVSQRINVSSKQVWDAVEALGDELEADFKRFREGIQSASESSRLQSDLIWWRQTLYSRIFRGSYRELAPGIVPFAMAYDLHGITNRSKHPLSVEYLLREALYALNLPGADDPTDLSNALEVMAADDSAVKFATQYPLYYKNSEDFLPLAGVVMKAAQDRKFYTSALDNIGLTKGAAATYGDLAVWIFRDLQAYAIATNIK